MEKNELYNIQGGDLGDTVAKGLKKNFEDIVDDVNNKLSKDNTEEYTPTGDYNPATKKYVDDSIDGITNDFQPKGEYATKDDLSVYLPLTGGTMTGPIISKSYVHVEDGEGYYTDIGALDGVVVNNGKSGKYNSLVTLTTGDVGEADGPCVAVKDGPNYSTFNISGITLFGKTTSDLLNGAGSTTSISDIATQVQAILVDGAPETLDTLNELAAALGDDPNFATTITTQLGNKVDKGELEKYLKLTGGTITGNVDINGALSVNAGSSEDIVAQTAGGDNRVTIGTLNDGGIIDISDSEGEDAIIIATNPNEGDKGINFLYSGDTYITVRNDKSANKYFATDGTVQDISTKFKTINGQSLIGSGNITIEGGETLGNADYMNVYGKVCGAFSSVPDVEYGITFSGGQISVNPKAICSTIPYLAAINGDTQNDKGKGILVWRNNELKLTNRVISGTDSDNYYTSINKDQIADILYRNNKGQNTITFHYSNGGDDVPSQAFVVNSGTTSERPTLTEGSDKGACYYDTDKNMPYWWDGTKWAGGNIYILTKIVGTLTEEELNDLINAINARKTVVYADSFGVMIATEQYVETSQVRLQMLQQATTSVQGVTFTIDRSTRQVVFGTYNLLLEPKNGVTGQVLTKTNTGYAWQDTQNASDIIINKLTQDEYDELGSKDSNTLYIIQG